MRIVLASYLVRGASTTVVMLPLVILGAALHRHPTTCRPVRGGRDSGRAEAESQPGGGSDSRLVATACGEAGTR